MARPGAAIQAFCEPVTTTSTPQASISNGTAPRPDAVDQDQRLGRHLADDGRELRDRVHHPGRGLVVGEQDGLVVAIPLELGAEHGRIGRLAPFDVDLGDVGAVGPGDLGEPVAERTDRDARTRSPGESVLTMAASRPPEPAVVMIAMSPVVPKYGFMPLRIRSSIAANSGPAVVDHLARAGLADARRQPGRAGNAQVWLEAVQQPPGWSVGVDGWSLGSPSRAGTLGARHATQVWEAGARRVDAAGPPVRSAGTREDPSSACRRPR